MAKSNGNEKHSQASAIVGTFLVLGFVGLLSPSRMPAHPAQSSSAELKTFQYASDSTTMIDAYIARPAGGAKSPAVILVHDDLGANNRFQEMARQFSAAGFVALLPNLPSRSRKLAL